MTEVATTTTETMERAWKELERHKVWMLTTRGGEGFHARPMHAVPRARSTASGSYRTGAG